MLRTKIGKYYVETSESLMLVTDMTESGVYVVDDSKYPEEADDIVSISGEYLKGKINKWFNYYGAQNGIRVDPGLLHFAMKHLFSVDFGNYLGRVSQEGKRKILFPFEEKKYEDTGIEVFMPSGLDYKKIPVMIKRKSPNRFAFIMPMIPFSDINFPQIIE